MKDWQQLFQNKRIRIVDHHDPALLGTAMASFAADDTLCESVGRSADEAACRFWVHDNTVVLGILDSRLPDVDNAVALLQKKGFDVVIRNSGGSCGDAGSGCLKFFVYFAGFSGNGNSFGL
ncbi:lipoyl transferase [Gracilibacillus boraciitolerans JCM 21714]|uniref:Lipoyl transferase n=1 Tax=Gracilibacillus boraciitolerans JCM 21714 TaxID=1298598 RepID=W4VHC9_9BACI|nr:hypothetical protein [Gracilibacillus boraciitolerans]GAE92556.1 lipoyl transferase [Gracilibacillus boraciitolerans JCM 21714]